MSRIKGVTITLYERTQTGTDDFNRPIYEETAVEIENVLVSPASSDDLNKSTNLSTDKLIYTVAIPKGDDHIWNNATVEFFDRKWKVVGMPLEGIEDLIPLDWNKKITVEAYE